MPDPKNPPSDLPGQIPEPAPGAPPAPRTAPDGPGYELEPIAPVPPAPPRAKHGPAGGLNQPSVLEGFDEDADFSKEPEVERAARVGGHAPKPYHRSPRVVPGSVGAEPPARPTEDSFIERGVGGVKVWAGVGLVCFISALLAAAINEQKHPVVASLLVIYNTILHTLTGVGALGIGAFLNHRPLGAIDLGLARMFAAVAGLLFLANCRITLWGTSSWEELGLGTLLYVLIVMLSFRLRGTPLATVVVAHFGLWLVVQIGMELTAWMHR